jgi:hypothetical protein
MATRATLLALALILPSPLAAQGSTWVVDAAGGGNTLEIQDAVNLAADGDLIYVRPGTYNRTVIDGKGVTIQGVGDVTMWTALFPAETLEIRNLAPDQEVVVRGLDFTVLAVVEQTAIVVESCGGAVLFEDCRLSGGGTPISIRDCASVTIARSEVIAPATFASYDIFFFFGFAAYTALAATDSNVFLYDTVVHGSEGTNSAQDFFITIPAGPGGRGIALSGSTLLASGCTIVGGSGGSDPAGLCYPGGDAAVGLRLGASGTSPSSTATLLDTTVTGGTGGIGGCGHPDGADALGVEVLAGGVETLPGTARSFSAASPAVEGTSIDVHLEGEPGDLVVLHAQLDIAPALYLASFGVALHMPLPVAPFALGDLPATGELDASFPIPLLSPGVGGFRFVGQTLFVGASGFYDGGPSMVVVVDSAL